MVTSGDAATRARALQRVALQGDAGERRRAAFLWGLLACDARAPQSAVTAFQLAAPTGGLAQLAARRLEETLAGTGSGLEPWTAAAASSWLPQAERARLVARGGETLLAMGEGRQALDLLDRFRWLQDHDPVRWLGIVAVTEDPAASAARRALATDYPHRWSRALPGRNLAAVTAELGEDEWQRHVVAWLEAGDPAKALQAAPRTGRERPLLTARALNRLRRPQQALRWAEQVDARRADGWLERSEALRQLAWGAPPAERERRWLEGTRAAEQALALASPGSPERVRAALILGEALVERGQGRRAVEVLLLPDVPGQPRWEWVWRRLVFLEARQGRSQPLAQPFPGRSNRGRRLESFWQARARMAHDQGRGLQDLADSGFPDLPALWASALLGRGGVPIVLDDAPLVVSPPPSHLADLVALGRVGDALVAWRGDLEGGSRPPEEWIAFVAKAALNPPEAVPFLIRAEPRLLSGPWDGLPRALLEQYLPLPFRSELEEAAAAAGVPPWVLAGLVRQESAWNPRAVSPAGAVGLAQVLPSTARDLARRHRLPAQMERSLTDPGSNLRIGALLLREWQRRLGGSLTVALAAYNGGERRARLFWERAGRGEGPEFVEGIEVPETWDYVHRVVLLAEGYRQLYWPGEKAYPWR